MYDNGSEYVWRGKEFRFNISDWNETKQDVEEFQYGFDLQRFNESNESVP